MTDDDPPAYYRVWDLFASAAASVDQINSQVRNHPDVQRLYSETMDQINGHLRRYPGAQRLYSERLERINQQVRIHRGLTDAEYFETIKRISAQVRRLTGRVQGTDEVGALDPDVRAVLALFDQLGVPRPRPLPGGP